MTRQVSLDTASWAVAVPPFDGVALFGIRSQSFTVSVWVITLAGSAVAFLVWPAAGSGTVFTGDFASTVFKYAFAGLQAFVVLCAVCEHMTFVPRPFFMLAALSLAVIGFLSFAYVQLYQPGDTSYGAALFPLMACAIPAFIPPHAVQVDIAQLTRWVLRLFFLASVFHVGWQVMAAVGLFDGEISHERSYVLVFLLLLAGFQRRITLCLLALFLIALSEYLRPSSTLAVCTVIAVAAIMLRLSNLDRTLSVLGYLLVGSILIQTLAFAASPDTVAEILKFETEVKQDGLDSYSRVDSVSNSDFRLAVFRGVHDELLNYSPWVGKSFTGDVNVYTGNYIHWPGSVGYTEIHSDFLAILLQGGLFGYFLIAAVFLGIVRVANLTEALVRPGMYTGGRELLRAIPFMTGIFGTYISYNPLMPKVEYTLFFLILLPITVLFARQLLNELTVARALVPSHRSNEDRLR